MTNLEQSILKALARARNCQTDPYLSLNVAWQECGSPDTAQFVEAWNTLKADRYVEGPFDTNSETPRGLGAITPKGESELAKLEGIS
jgi:hypothetical protein